MVAQRWEADAEEEAVLADGVAAWERLHERNSHRFERVEVRARVRRYLAGLLGRVGRKNRWQLAEAIGERGPQGVQHLLNAAVWDAEAVCDDLPACWAEGGSVGSKPAAPGAFPLKLSMPWSRGPWAWTRPVTTALPRTVADDAPPPDPHRILSPGSSSSARFQSRCPGAHAVTMTCRRLWSASAS